MTQLVISFEIDGIHCWPNAPEQYKEFRQPHRHLFKVVGWYSTGCSSDPTRRDKELFELRQEAINCLKNFGTSQGQEPVDYGQLSCEGIADYLKLKIGFSKVFVGEEYWLGALVQ